MIVSKRFKDRRTGEIVTRFNIMDIQFMDEIDELGSPVGVRKRSRRSSLVGKSFSDILEDRMNRR